MVFRRYSQFMDMKIEIESQFDEMVRQLEQTKFDDFGADSAERLSRIMPRMDDGLVWSA